MKRIEILLMILQVPVDFLLLIGAGITAYVLRFTPWATDLKPVTFGFTFGTYLAIVYGVALGWIILFAILGLYTRDPNRKLLPELTRVLLAVASGLSLIALYMLFTQAVFDSRFLVAAGAGLAVVYVSLGRMFMRGLRGVLYRSGVGLRRVILIGDTHVAKSLDAVLRSRPELGYNVVGEFAHFTGGSVATAKRAKPDEIIFTNPRAHEGETLAAMKFCQDHHIMFKYSADMFDTFATNMRIHPLAGIPIVELRPTPLDGWGRVMKRMFDIVGSIVILVALSPFLLFFALLIAVETGRPVFYQNERVGIRGRRFWLWKYRSMYQKDCTGPQFGAASRSAEAKERKLIQTQNTKSGPIYKIADDPRVTPFGRWLRRWSIDELPQFLNVLAGDMSIVGPRPHQPREVAKYEDEYRTVFTLKPGITGLAQISGRSDLEFDEEMRLDTFYTEKWSLLLDFVVVLKTPFVIVKKRRAL